MRQAYIFLKFLTTFISLGVTSLFAQDFTGYSIGSWAGINSLHINPANVVDSRYMADINLVMGNVAISNNFATIDQNALFSGVIDSNSVTRDYSKANYDALVNVRVQGPSFMFSFGKKKNGVRPNGIAFTSNARVFVNADDLDNKYVYWATNGNTPAIPLADYLQPYSETFMQVTANVWAEYGITYGRVVLDQKKHFLKVGGTLKLLQGMGGLYATGRNLNYMVNDSIRSVQGEFDYGHSTNLNFKAPNWNPFKFDGAGLGGDIGVVYEYRPKYEKYQYDIDRKSVV